ncbi:hypothetical protein MTO96_047201 [Rhipicephalus appendiculatus]
MDDIMFDPALGIVFPSKRRIERLSASLCYRTYRLPNGPRTGSSRPWNSFGLRDDETASLTASLGRRFVQFFYRCPPYRRSIDVASNGREVMQKNAKEASRRSSAYS